MQEFTGKYGTAKVFTDSIEQEAVSQLYTLLCQEFAAGSTIRMMPDIHAGKGCVIGTTMTLGGKIAPNLVGVDIGCGMLVAKLSPDCACSGNFDPAKLDGVIRKRIPSGFNVRSHRHKYAKEPDIGSLRIPSFNADRAKLSIGTLGGGNHFIEACRCGDGGIAIVIHSGSRHLGGEIAKHYADLAYDLLKGRRRGKDIIERLAAEGRAKDIEGELKKMNESFALPPRDLAWLEGEPADEYLHDMKIAQDFAHWNRRAILDEIMNGLGIEPRHIDNLFETVHNYIDFSGNILRKGAVSALEGELLIIPMNMRDGSLLCRGKGNPDWNQSAPHGAGRLMSRGKAKETLSMEQFRKEMEGVYSTSVCEATLDEAPMAYKPMKDIVDNIGDTVDIIEVIKPIYNYKDSSK